MTQWYYADRQRQQQGPLTGPELAALFRAGQIDAATLVWHEGLAGWQPLSASRGELELDAPPATLDFRAGPEPLVAPEPVAAPDAGTPGYSPYAAPAAAMAMAQAGPVLGGEVVMAGFWKRVAAYLIDSMVVGVIGGIIGMMLGMLIIPLAAIGGDGGAVALIGAQIAIQLISIAIYAAYYAFFHSSSSQATLGKMAVGIKVVRTDGTRISLLRGIGRYFASLLSGLILGIGFLMAAFTERKQGLHDILCDTLVVDKWAYTDHPEWQRRELGTVTIVVLVLYGLLLALVAVALVAMIGMLSTMHW